MFEKEIKFIIDFTLNRVNKLGSYFPFERLASAEIHPAILLYISAHLDYLIYEDRKKLLQNSSFDYSGSEISRYFNIISEEIKKNKRLAFEDVKTLVTHAVTFNINYLVRPNWTLGKLIFDEKKTRNVNEIKMMLNYLYYYDYVKNVFYGYFSKRKILSLSETEFGIILGKIDKQMFGEHTHDLIDNALVSIGDFFNEGGVNKTRIQTQTVELFFKEKELIEALFKLRRSISADDKRKYDIEEIRKILYSKENVKAHPDEKTADLQGGDAAESTEVTNIEPETDSEAAASRPDEVRPEENSGRPSEEAKAWEEVVKEEPSGVSLSDETETQEEIFESRDEELRGEVMVNSSETADEEIEKKEIELESPEDFFTRYKTELKSLEVLEEQLDNLNSDDDLTFTELDADEELSEEEIEPAGTEQAASDNPDRKKTGEIPAPDVSDEETNSDELIIEEEELSFDDDESSEEKKPGSTASPRKNNDILSFLSDKEMEKIVANVFNEDEEDFVNTMEKISESADYDAATEILKAVFFSYKVSPYSRDAVILTNAVNNYFNQD